MKLNPAAAGAAVTLLLAVSTALPAVAHGDSGPDRDSRTFPGYRPGPSTSSCSRHFRYGLEAEHVRFDRQTDARRAALDRRFDEPCDRARLQQGLREIQFRSTEFHRELAAREARMARDSRYRDAGRWDDRIPAGKDDECGCSGDKGCGDGCKSCSGGGKGHGKPDTDCGCGHHDSGKGGHGYDDRDDRRGDDREYDNRRHGRRDDD